MELLVPKANKLAILGCLSETEKRRTADAITISQTIQRTWKRQKYKLFLCGLLENSGPHSFLLCAIALGQVIIVNMKQRDRDKLVGLIKNETQLAHPTIRDLAAQQHIPISSDSEFRSGAWDEANYHRLKLRRQRKH